MSGKFLKPTRYLCLKLNSVSKCVQNRSTGKYSGEREKVLPDTIAWEYFTELFLKCEYIMWACHIYLNKIIGKSWLATSRVCCQCRVVQTDVEFPAAGADVHQTNLTLKIYFLFPNSSPVLWFFFNYILKQLLSLVFPLVFQTLPAGICNYLYLRA